MPFQNAQEPGWDIMKKSVVFRSFRIDPEKPAALLIKGMLFIGGNVFRANGAIAIEACALSNFIIRRINDD